MNFIYDVPGNDLDRAGKASTDVKKLLLRLGIPPQIIKRTAIAMYEGEMNIAIHGGGGNIHLTIEDTAIILDLVDQGPGIVDIDQAMQEGWSSAPEWVRQMGFGAGMGLPNMKRNSDEFVIESSVGNGTKIHMVINVTP